MRKGKIQRGKSKKALLDEERRLRSELRGLMPVVGRFVGTTTADHGPFPMVDIFEFDVGADTATVSLKWPATFERDSPEIVLAGYCFSMVFQNGLPATPAADIRRVVSPTQAIELGSVFAKICGARNQGQIP